MRLADLKGIGAMPNIPEDIIIIILLKLPLITLLQFKIVCKRWNSIISEPNFYHRNSLLLASWNIGKYVIDDESSVLTDITDRSGCNEYQFVTNSCDGFVIIVMGGSLFLFNPVTRYSKKVLDLCAVGTSDKHHRFYITFGFFYDAYAKDYKVIVARHQYQKDVLCASLKEKMWKKVVGVEQQFDISTCESGPVVNGRMHWTACEKVKNSSIAKREIIWFDAGKNVFTVLPSPNLNNVDEYAIVGLGVLFGCLSISRVHSDKSVEVLMMKQYGVAESWSRMFLVPNANVNRFTGDFTPLLVTKDGDIIIRIDRHVVAVYIVSKGLINNVGFPITGNIVHAASFEESRASPFSSMGV